MPITNAHPTFVAFDYTVELQGESADFSDATTIWSGIGLHQAYKAFTSYCGHRRLVAWAEHRVLPRTPVELKRV